MGQMYRTSFLLHPRAFQPLFKDFTFGSPMGWQWHLTRRTPQVEIHEVARCGQYTLLLSLVLSGGLSCRAMVGSRLTLCSRTPSSNRKQGADLQVWMLTGLWRLSSCFSLGFFLVQSFYIHCLQCWLVFAYLNWRAWCCGRKTWNS